MSADQESSAVPVSMGRAQANFRWLVSDVAWFGLAFPASGRFLSVFAIRVNASPSLLGWMTALPSLIALVSSAGSVRWRARHQTLLQALWLPALIFRLMFLLPAFTPFFPERWQPYWLVAAVSLPALATGVQAVLFLVLMRESVEPSQLTALLSRRSLAFNLTVAVATLGFGFWLETMPYPLNYQVMFVAAFLLSLVSFASVMRVQPLVSDLHPPADHPPLRPWQSSGFRRTVAVSTFVHVAFFSIQPIIPLRLMEELGADEAYMSLFTLSELAGAVVAATCINRLVNRIGHLMTITVGMAGTAVAGMVFALAGELGLMLPAAALSGAAWTVSGVPLFGYFSANAPEENLTRFTTVYNQMVMLAVFVGPMLGSQLAEYGVALVTVLVAGAFLRLAVAVGVALADLNAAGRVYRLALARWR